MSRERSIESFILKRQDYGEADQIITIFSKEEGKVRALVKAAKLPTSKLQPVLQPLFETRVTLTGSSSGPGLSKVIGAQLIKAYSGILQSEHKLGAWYMASELIIRALPDSAPNEPLFRELEQFADFLHEVELTSEEVKRAITQFQIKSLAHLGLGIKMISHDFENTSVWFSQNSGGFVSDNTSDSISVTASSYFAFLTLVKNNYFDAFALQDESYASLYSLVNRFVTYQLERELKSQRFMGSA